MSINKTVAFSSEIKLKIGLNSDRLPVKLAYSVEDEVNGEPEMEIKAFMVSLFEKNSLETLKIDLWSAEMQIGEMDRMVFQTLRGLADTYFNATKNNELATQMQQFAQYFGEKAGLISVEEGTASTPTS